MTFSFIFTRDLVEGVVAGMGILRVSIYNCIDRITRYYFDDMKH